INEESARRGLDFVIRPHWSADCQNGSVRPCSPIGFRSAGGVPGVAETNFPGALRNKELRTKSSFPCLRPHVETKKRTGRALQRNARIYGRRQPWSRLPAEGRAASAAAGLSGAGERTFAKTIGAQN